VRPRRTWANHHPPGDTTVRGVAVHRFPTVRERSRDFQSFSRRVLQEATRSLGSLR